MSKKYKALIAIGGTGGHVFPGCNLAEHLIQNDYDVELISDMRGYKFLKKYKNCKISTLPSFTLKKRNIFKAILSLILIFYSIIRSFIFLIFNRPSVIFGMGGYASFPICTAAILLRIKFIIYENNLIIGRANKSLLPFTKKLLVSHEEIEGIPKKYHNKILKIGNIIKKEIINFKHKETDNSNDNSLGILVLGGSQAAKIFAEILPKIFQECLSHRIPLKIYQHCLQDQNESLKKFYENIDIDYETFNFTDNIIKYFSKVKFAITRSGSSMLAELTNANIPFISVPLPSSADNHQLKNAIYYKKKNFAFLIEEKDLNHKLLTLIKKIQTDKSVLTEIIQNQKQYSDKNVYNNIDKALKEILDEKN